MQQQIVHCKIFNRGFFFKMFDSVLFIANLFRFRQQYHLWYRFRFRPMKDTKCRYNRILLVLVANDSKDGN